MTLILEPFADGRTSAVRRRVGRGFWRTGWPAFLTTALIVFGALLYYGVGARDLVVYLAYLALGITLPGALIWRALNRRVGYLAEDLAAGAAVGWVLEVFTYIGARWLGLPLLVLAFPVFTLALFGLVPGLRRYWRGSGRALQPPAWWGWGVAAVFLVPFLYLCDRVFGHTGLDPTNVGWANGDMMMHLAMVGEAKHHMPLHVPWVAGDVMYYHWFDYAEQAATSWVTGVEPNVLIRRLGVLPYLAVAVVGIAVCARRLTGRWWTGPVAAALAYLAVAPHPFGWQIHNGQSAYGFSGVEDGGLLRLTLWTSPTQTFAAALFPAALLVTVLLLRGRGGAGRWLLLALLLAGLMGAKASYLPVFLAGLVAALGVALVRRRRAGALIGMVVLTAALLAFAQVVLFGGSTQGMDLLPFGTLLQVGLGDATRVADVSNALLPLAPLVGIFALTTALLWAGIAGLWRDRRLFAPEFVLLGAMGAAGLGVAVLFVHEGYAQLYFAQVGRPCLALAAVAGLAVALRGVPRRVVVHVIVWPALGGVGLLLALRGLGPQSMPVATSRSDVWRVMATLVTPYLVIGAVLAAAGACLLAAHQRGWLRVGVAAPLAIAAMALGATTATLDRVAPVVQAVADGGLAARYPRTNPSVEGTMVAGAWLRDHSDPRDLLATNAHCSGLINRNPCQNLHFGIAAATERRVLVEGWGYTPRSSAAAAAAHVQVGMVPFYEPLLLRDNDAAFHQPSAATIGRLRDTYGVRWLFVDRTQLAPAPNLGDFATLRFTHGPVSIYSLPPS